MKNYEDYVKEHLTLLNMYRCSNAYMISRHPETKEQNDNDMQFMRESQELYIKYRRRLEKKCMKKTGRSLDDMSHLRDDEDESKRLLEEGHTIEELIELFSDKDELHDIYINSGLMAADFEKIVTALQNYNN